MEVVRERSLDESARLSYKKARKSKPLRVLRIVTIIDLLSVPLRQAHHARIA